jgi:hypothetical protein
MSATTAELSFTEMLDANERETAKWQDWFGHQPAEVLDLPLDIALAKDVREFLLHIFAVELRYAERLTGSAVTEYEALPTGSVGELFATGERARKLYREYFSRATDADLATSWSFPRAPLVCCAPASARCSRMPCCTEYDTGRSSPPRCAKKGTALTGLTTSCSVM